MPLLGRYTWRFTTLTVAAGGTKIVSADTHRVRLLISSSAGATLNISPDRAVTVPPGIIVNSTLSTIEISYNQHGDVVTAEWWATGANATVAVLEIVELTDG